MTAQIICFADRQAGGRNLRPLAAHSNLPEPIDLLRDIARRLGLPPLEDETGDTGFPASINSATPGVIPVKLGGAQTAD